MPYKTLITGATGFLGAPLVAFLTQQGHKVVAFADTFETPQWQSLTPDILKEVQRVEGDVRDPKAVKAVLKDCLHVFHMATLMPHESWSSHAYIETNVTGTLNVLHAALPEDCKVVHISDAQVYGTGLYSPIDEKHPLLGQSPYASSKIAADMLAESFVGSFGLNITILRPFHVYGLPQNPEGLIAQLMESVRQQSPIPDPYSCRDLLYMDDFLAACASALQKPFTGQIFNIASGQIVSNQEVAKALASQMGMELNEEQGMLQTPKRVMPSMPGHIQKAKDTLGWEPKVSLQEGIQRLLTGR